MSTTTPQTLTANATREDWPDSEYRDAYQELRGYDEETGKYAISLDKFVAMVGAPPSKAMWSKYHRGETDELTRQMKQRIRALFGQPLPLTVAEAIAHVSPDAEVVSVTKAERPDRLILAHTGDQAMTIHLNGAIAISGRVTKVTSDVRTKRKPLYRPVVDMALKERVQASGLSVNELLEMALETLQTTQTT